MFWKSKLLTKDSRGLMQQYMSSSVTKLRRFFQRKGQHVSHKEVYYLETNNWSLTALSHLKSVHTPGSAFLGKSCQVSPSLNAQIFRHKYILPGQAAVRGGDANHKQLLQAPCLYKMRCFKLQLPPVKSPPPNLKLPLQAYIYILLLVWDTTLVASAAWQDGQREGVAGSLNSKESKALGTCILIKLSEMHLIAVIYSSYPPDSQKFPFYPKQ